MGDTVGDIGGDTSGNEGQTPKIIKKDNKNVVLFLCYAEYMG